MFLTEPGVHPSICTGLSVGLRVDGTGVRGLLIADDADRSDRPRDELAVMRLECALARRVPVSGEATMMMKSSAWRMGMKTGRPQRLS